MYPDLYRGLGLTQANLSKYDTPLMAFDGSMVIPMGQIRLLVEIGGRKECVDFIVVHSYSLYTATLGLPQIRSIGAVPSSLHQKVKFPTDQGIFELRGDQNPARQCLIATIRHEQLSQPELPKQQLPSTSKYQCETVNNWTRYIQRLGIVSGRALGLIFSNVGPNPREWVESCYCLSK